MQRTQSRSTGWQHRETSPSFSSTRRPPPSIRDYLSHAKTQLHSQLKLNGNQGNVNLVIGNESADLDSIMCALIYSYSRSINVHDPLIPITNIPASDLPLRPELTALLKHADLAPSDLITLDDLGEAPFPLEATNIVLVDHNALQGTLGKLYSDSVRGVIDHHDDEGKVAPEVHPRIVARSGRTC